MNRQQKIAWYSITVLSAVLLFTAAMTYWFVTKFGWQRIELGLCHIGFACIAGIGPLIFRKNKTQAVDTDERDYLFELRASFAGFAASYCFLVIIGTAILLVHLLGHGLESTISVFILPPLIGGSYVTAEFVRSIAILSQYGWRKKAS